MGGTMDGYKLAIVSLIVVLIPLFYVSVWLGVAACFVVYGLLAWFANSDFDKRHRKHQGTRRGDEKR